MPYRAADSEQDGTEAADLNCWIWTGHTVDGLPNVRTESSTTTGARWIWQRHRNLLNPDQILHRDCPTRLCVNPSHHSAVTRKEHAYRKGQVLLSEREAYWAWRSAKCGMSQKQVAELFKVSETTVGRIVRGEYVGMKKVRNGEA
jgi:hypothetical protein